MGKHYSLEYKQKVLDDYKSGKYGGRHQVAKHYGLNPGTIWNWIAKDRKQGSLVNDINHTRGKYSKPVTLDDWKERYEILKKYQTFLKAQRARK